MLTNVPTMKQPLDPRFAWIWTAHLPIKATSQHRQTHLGGANDAHGAARRRFLHKLGGTQLHATQICGRGTTYQGNQPHRQTILERGSTNKRRSATQISTQIVQETATCETDPRPRQADRGRTSNRIAARSVRYVGWEHVYLAAATAASGEVSGSFAAG